MIDLVMFIMFVVGLLIGIMSIKSAYHAGVVDGYGYSRDSQNSGYAYAGRYLKTHMNCWWSELNSTCQKSESYNEVEGEQKMDELTNILLDHGYSPEDVAQFIGAYASGGIESAVACFEWADNDQHDYTGELRSIFEEFEKNHVA